MMTTGWLIGELIRRVSGKSLGEFFNIELGEPYGLNYWIGLPESKHERVAEIIPMIQVLMINQVILQQLLEIIEILYKGFP